MAEKEELAEKLDDKFGHTVNLIELFETCRLPLLCPKYYIKFTVALC